MRALRILLIGGGVVGTLALAYDLGTRSITSAFAHVSWWQFAVICLVYGVNVVIDTIGWRYTLVHGRPSFVKLLAARCASEASNALTVLASVGGETIKAWLLQLEIPYQESIPSLILAKTAEVLGQTLLLGLGILVAMAKGLGGPSVRTAMDYLLAAQLIAVGGFMLVQLAGVVGKAGGMLSWAGLRGTHQVRQLDADLRGFYRNEWRRFVASTTLHFGGALVAVFEAFIILLSFQALPSLAMATVIEALWSGVRFVTFFVPGGLGPLEGANAAAFPAVGLAASAGLAFVLIRRARQAVWITLGIVILVAMRPRGAWRDKATDARGLDHRAELSGHFPRPGGVAH